MKNINDMTPSERRTEFESDLLNAQVYKLVRKGQTETPTCPDSFYPGRGCDSCQAEYTAVLIGRAVRQRDAFLGVKAP